MLDNEFKIGETIKDTETFGDVKVIDIFTSITNPTFFCYRVQDIAGQSFLANEEELFSAQTKFE